MRGLIVTLLALLLWSTQADARNYCRSMVTGRYVTRVHAMLDRQHHKCVPPLLAEWLVVRWSWGGCQLWHNDVSPQGGGWIVAASATSQTEGWVKLQSLYAKRLCQ